MTAVTWLYIELWKQNDFSLPSNLLEKAKEMELQQRKEDFREGWKGNKHKDWNCEFYLIKHFNNDFKTE